MARMTIGATCKTCGKEFRKNLRPGGLETSVVNCPECRAKKKTGGGGYHGGISKENYDYINARFRCNDCGKVFDRTEGRKHRQQTGHTNVTKL